MAVRYDIQAKIVDIRYDTPTKNDQFFIDTNVWYWTTYSAASILTTSYQTKEYPGYIKKILEKKSTIMRCELILSELAHVIEKSEFEIFCKKSDAEMSKKEFRHNYADERNFVVGEIENAWGTICESSESFGILLDEENSNYILEDLKQFCLDCYDVVYLREMRDKLDEPRIITDDGDFATVADITVFTANNTVIRAADDAGMLIRRS